MKRPKKPTISDIKEKKFSTMIEGLKHRPHNGIVNRVDLNRFSLEGNSLYHYKPELLATEEYKRCLDLFRGRLPNEHSLPTQEAVFTLQLQLQMIDNVMFNKEMKHTDELKQIAVDTICSIFDIPHHVNILPEIGRNLEINPEEQDDSAESILSLEPEEMKELMEQIRKREILNGIVQGAAMHIWKSAHYIIKDQINNLDPMLMILYDQYITSIGWLMWQMSPDDMQDAIGGGSVITQGFCRLEFEKKDEPECNIYCHAINFPVLLHEVTKGAIDYLICHSIPKGYSEEKLKYYYAKADSYKNEVWHYLLSPTIWNKLVIASDVETQSLPLVIARLTRLSYQELTDVLKACIDGAEFGRRELLANKII